MPVLALALLIVTLALIGPPVAAQPTPAPAPAPMARDLFIAITPGRCELLESGIGFGDEALRNQAQGMVSVQGQQREEEPQVYSCAVEVADEPLRSRLQGCALSGFNAASTYFFKGEASSLRRACSARRLRNGHFYFLATGIAADQCEWSCTLR